MRGEPNLLHLWLLAGTPVSFSQWLPILVGIFGGRGIQILASFVLGLFSGFVNGLVCPEVKAATPAEESNPDLRR